MPIVSRGDLFGGDEKKPPLSRRRLFEDGRWKRGLCGDGDLVEDFGPVLAGAGGGGVFVEGVAGDEGKGEGGFGVDHLLVGEVDLAPGAGFLEGGTRQSAVAGVGYGDLDGVLVHGGFDSEDVGGYDDVLGEVFGDSSADHEQAGGGVGDLELGDLVEVLGGVDGDHGLALASVLVGDEAEAGGAVGEGGAEDGDVLLVGGEDDGVAAAGCGVLPLSTRYLPIAWMNSREL